jgi:hypothetical protein
MPHGPNAAWLEHFAARLIQVEPTTTPLDAVRQAVQSFPCAAGLAPEKAAEIFVSSERSKARMASSSGPGLTDHGAQRTGLFF